MKKIFMIDGGAGRVISAIPALERYISEHPEENVKIFVYGWDNLFWSNPILQNNTFNANDKGCFDKYIKDADFIISPEPYRLPEYINQKCSMCEAFDILINGDTSGKNVPILYTNKIEKYQAKSIINDVKKYQNKDKTIVIQPFGSTAYFYSDKEKEEVVDSSSRSFDLLLYSKLVYNLSQNYNIILFADQKFHFKEDIFSYKLNADLRGYLSVIEASDYFIGCDSVGQHMARAVNVPGTIIFGSTYPENVSYPDWFHIIDYNKAQRTYSPLRINEIDCNMADRKNQNCMNYNEDQIKQICSEIVDYIELK